MLVSPCGVAQTRDTTPAAPAVPAAGATAAAAAVCGRTAAYVAAAAVERALGVG